MKPRHVAAWSLIALGLCGLMQSPLEYQLVALLVTGIVCAGILAWEFIDK